MIAGWHEFYTMAGTAAASLIGLLFVALSTNREHIGRHPGHRSIARQSVLAYLVVLTIAALVLIPGQQAEWLGIEIMVACVPQVVYALIVQRQILMTIQRGQRSYLLASAFYDSGLMLLVLGGACVLLHQGALGFRLLFLAVVAVGTLGIRNSWVLAMQVDDPAERLSA